MDRIYKLYNKIKNYEWGSPDLIPQFLGMKNQGCMPYAEMWMGTHDSALSLTDEIVSLKEIAGNLPFLFKLLAVEKPLSIQAHPNREKALEGFSLEETAGLDIKSPMRNYKDKNHKSELLCAISPFTLMAGFKELEAIGKYLKEFALIFPQLKEIILPLQRSLNTGSLAVFFRILFNLSMLEREYISSLIKEKDIKIKSDIITCEQWSLIKSFASMYPQDPATLSPLYLNLLELQPGRAVYIPSGMLHSYISGFGVEVMTASDNVLRGGLTPKYIDIPELMNITDFEPYYPKIISPVYNTKSPSWFCYECEEFTLALANGGGGEQKFRGQAPAICLVTQGVLSANGLTFNKGDSFFIPKGMEELKFSGNFSAFCVYSTGSTVLGFN